MKLIIDISEDTYEDIIKNGFIYDEDNEVVTYAFKNGIPLDKIKSEITSYKDDKLIHVERNEMIDIVLEIINEYTKGAEE